MLLNALCTTDPIRCRPDVTALEAAQLMRQKHTGDLVVVDENEAPIGVITDRDIVIEVLAAGLSPAETPVGRILRAPVIIAHEQEDASHALELMRVHGVRRLPVVNRDGALSGIVTLDDLLRNLAADADLLVQLTEREQARERRVRR